MKNTLKLEIRFMKKGKILLLSSVAALSLGLASCGGKSGKTVIGICQLAVHDALGLATKGFQDAVIEGLGKDNVEFDYQNANGEVNTCSTIVNSFVSKNVDLIMANATPAVQAAYNATTTIPILGTSVTEYGSALGIKDFDGITGVNVSGTSDLAPLDEQVQMIIDIFPETTSVGLLYCSSEANSKYQIDVVEGLLEDKNISTVRMPFTDSNDLRSVLDANLSKVDVVYVPTDNTCADNALTIDAACSEKNVPVVAGEESMCKKCGVVTLSISYYAIGLKTGQMAVDILKNGKDITKMAIEYDDAPVKKYNPEICTRLGVTVPSDYVAIE